MRTVKLNPTAYSEAIVNLAKETQSVRDFLNSLELLVALINREPRLFSLLSKRKTTDPRRREIVNVFFGDIINVQVINFINLIYDEQGSFDLEHICKLAIAQLRELLGIVHAKVTSAREISAQQKALLLATLIKKHGPQTSVAFEIDESLIGGMAIKIGSQVIDGSIATKLKQYALNPSESIHN